MVIWLTGNSGSGKTTLATAFREKHPEWILLDGNVMRATISLGAGFSKEERERHNLRVARLANALNEQGHKVIVAVIAPFASTRKKINEIVDCTWVYMERTLPEKKDYPYQVPINVRIISVDGKAVEEEVGQLEWIIRKVRYG